MNRKKDNLEEWKMTYRATMQFNDLLMRLRTLGFPAVMTVTGGGVVYSFAGRINAFRILTWVLGLALTLSAAVLLVLFIWLLHRPYVGRIRSEPEIFDICLWPLEIGCWAIIPSTALIYAIIFWVNKGSILNNYASIPLAVFVLAFGLMLMVSLYFLDRFYYYCLLMGAVKRLEELEDDLNYQVSHKISWLTPRHRSAAATTLLYFLPGMIGYLMLFTMLVFF